MPPVGPFLLTNVVELESLAEIGKQGTGGCVHRGYAFNRSHIQRVGIGKEAATGLNTLMADVNTVTGTVGGHCLL